MRKSKRREDLRDKLRGSRPGRRGRPLEPPRSEKEAVERARVRLRELSLPAANKLGDGLEGKASSSQLAAADSILDRAGLGKSVSVEVTDPFTQFLDEVGSLVVKGTPKKAARSDE